MKKTAENKKIDKVVFNMPSMKRQRLESFDDFQTLVQETPEEPSQDPQAIEILSDITRLPSCGTNSAEIKNIPVSYGLASK